MVFLLGSAVSALQAQKEYNMWYFGNKGGLNFNTYPPSVLSDGKMMSVQSSSSICDSNGNLLFYTDGDTVWNRNHLPMMNGIVTLPNLRHESAVQGSIILPVPQIPNLYYIIMGPSFESINRDSMLRYWVVDMTKDGGLGAVTEKEKPLFARPSEGMAIAKHANGYDYWIGAVCDPYAKFRCVRTTNGLFITAPIEQKIDKTMGYSEHDYKFSPDSRIISVHSNILTVNKERHLNIFRFDNNTGLISKRIKLPRSMNVLQYTIEFSPNSRFLYVQDLGPERVLWQYDLSIWDSTTIVDSKTAVHRINARGNDLRYMQIGPDGKIYGFNAGTSKISVIDYPDLKGLSCGFRSQVVDISPGFNFVGGPYYPSCLIYERRFELGPDKYICRGDSVKIGYLPWQGDSLLWNTGDTSGYITVKRSGTYVITVKNRFKDSVSVIVGPKYKVFIGNDTAFCHQFSHILKTGSNWSQYNWNTGSVAPQITVNQQGIYSVKVLDSNSCPSGDTINIDEIKKPAIKVNYDSVTCKYVYLSIDTLKGLKYLWSTGEKNNAIKVENKGWYNITASHQFCSNSDSIYVDQLAMPEVDLGIDTSLCANEIVLTTKEKGKYLWNTSETRPSIVINQPGKYWLTVSRNNCSATDTIDVKLCEDMLVYIPIAFTPNDDNLNEVFKVYGSNIVHVEIQIFSRWGEKILETSGKDPYWSGTYKNEVCMEGVYCYLVKVQGKKAGSVKYLRGTVTLLR